MYPAVIPLYHSGMTKSICMDYDGIHGKGEKAGELRQNLQTEEEDLQMKCEPICIKARNGQEIVLRSASVTDAPALLEYLRVTAAESPFLMRDPDEIRLTLLEEQVFLLEKADAERELLLIALADGKHIGNCALMQIGSSRRYAHRCGIAIALYQAYCGLGIGTAMLETVLRIAKETGYEQAELEVMSANTKAAALYEKLGFQRYGTFPRNMKYPDGHYDDSVWMMKRL